MSRMGDTNSGTGQSGQGDQGSVGQAAAQVGQNLRDSQLRDQAQNYYEQGRQRANEWEEGLESYIQDKPLQAVMIAAGVGVLLGLLWKRS